MQVDLTEMLGTERLVHGRIGDADFTLRIDGTLRPPAAGETVALNPAPDHLHWFDPQTQHRL